MGVALQTPTNKKTCSEIWPRNLLPRQEVNRQKMVERVHETSSRQNIQKSLLYQAMCSTKRVISMWFPQHSRLLQKQNITHGSLLPKGSRKSASTSNLEGCHRGCEGNVWREKKQNLTKLCHQSKIFRPTDSFSKLSFENIWLKMTCFTSSNCWRKAGRDGGKKNQNRSVTKLCSQSKSLTAFFLQDITFLLFPADRPTTSGL